MINCKFEKNGRCSKKKSFLAFCDCISKDIDPCECDKREARQKVYERENIVKL